MPTSLCSLCFESIPCLHSSILSFNGENTKIPFSSAHPLALQTINYRSWQRSFPKRRPFFYLFIFSLSSVFDFSLFFFHFEVCFLGLAIFFFLFLKSNYSAYFEYFDAVVVAVVVFLFLCIVHFEVLFYNKVG